MRTALRLLAVLPLLAAVGCASTAALEGKWIEVRSENFSTYTTLAEPEARRLLENLELFRAALLAVTKLRDAPPRVPTEIYAFQSTNDYAPFRPQRGVPGYFVPGLRANWVALDAGENGILARAILYHEYTHFLMNNEGRLHYPHWFSEGFADVLSSVHVMGAMVQIGSVPAHRHMWFLYGLPMLPYERVIRAQSPAHWANNDVGLYYAQAWLLAHYLTLGRMGQGGSLTTQMERYLERIDQHVDKEQAFLDAFGIDFDGLDTKLEKYLDEIPQFGLPRRNLGKGLEIDVRPVPRDEIGTRLGWLAMGIGKYSLAEAYFERASEANPNNARAIAGIADTHKIHERWAEAEAAYRRSLELAPDDWQNHLEVAEYFADRATKEEEGRDERLVRAREHFERAIDLAPDVPEGYAVLGTTYTIDGQPPEPGIEALERAARLLPSHPWIEFPLAKLHHRAGHRERAIELLRRVVHQPHGNVNREAVELLEELERAEAEAAQSR